MDSLCVEAVDKILKVVQEAAETPGHLKDPQESEQSGEGLTTEGELREVFDRGSCVWFKEGDVFSVLCVSGEDGGERPPTEQTFILVYGVSD